MPATIRYNTLRLAMVIIVGAVLYVIGVRGAVLLFLAVVISMPLSYFLLARWRIAMIEEFAAGKARRFNPMRAVSGKIDAANRAEDDAIDAAQDSTQDRDHPTSS